MHPAIPTPLTATFLAPTAASQHHSAAHHSPLHFPQHHPQSPLHAQNQSLVLPEAGALHLIRSLTLAALDSSSALQPKLPKPARPSGTAAIVTKPRDRLQSFVSMDQQSQAGGQQQARQQPLYDITQGGHYGASAALSAQGYVPHTELYSGLWSNINQGLTGTSRDILATYWQQTINHLESHTHDFKIHQLPLARIKKVMKADPEVKMISAEAPILFAKGCDIFITELTMRAWIHAEDNKRRTLQRSDIAAALSKSDMFDFLIDIVPREDSAGGAAKRPTTSGQAAAAQQVPQQQTMGPPQTDYGMPQHSGMPPPDQTYGRQPQSMYGGHMGGEGPQDPNQGYGQPGPGMFPSGDIYNPYGQAQFGGAPQQQMYPGMQRPQSQGYASRPRTGGADDEEVEQEYGPG